MVAVGFVVIGRQHRCEQVARPVPYLAQESGARTAAAPVGGDADARAVLEPEGGHIDCIGAGMLAPRALVAAVDAAARIAPEMLDRGDAAAEVAERCGLDDVPFPKRKAGRDGAAGAQIAWTPGDAQRAAGRKRTAFS